MDPVLRFVLYCLAIAIGLVIIALRDDRNGEPEKRRSDAASRAVLALQNVEVARKNKEDALRSLSKSRAEWERQFLATDFGKNVDLHFATTVSLPAALLLDGKAVPIGEALGVYPEPNGQVRLSRMNDPRAIGYLTEELAILVKLETAKRVWLAIFEGAIGDTALLFLLRCNAEYSARLSITADVQLAKADLNELAKMPGIGHA